MSFHISLPLSPSSASPDEADITFTDLQTLLFDSPCVWSSVQEDSESSDSGLGSPDSNSEISFPASPECPDKSQPRGFAVRRTLFPSKRPRDDDSCTLDTNPWKRPRYFTADQSDCKVILWEDEADETRTKTAVEKLQTVEENLVGDGSKTHTLPTIQTRNHTDLKTVTETTVRALLQGKYDDVISGYKIIDCRYPYEYQGGHIQGAVNSYTEQDIVDLLHHPVTSSDQPTVLIFHCEFSSERGPKLLRHLRSEDRKLNHHRYPQLCYPEIYLLQAGYKAFFAKNKSFCEPETYVPMLHNDHTDDLKQFRARSKSWTAGQRRTETSRRLLATRTFSSPSLCNSPVLQATALQF